VPANRAFLIALLCAAPVAAHDVITTNLTWSKEISRVVYQHCASCHHEGGTAFSLTSYEDARPWAKAIRDEVLNRRMPPWDAVKGIGEFRDDTSLSVPEIDLVVGWVEGGAPEGNPIYAPESGSWSAPVKPADPARGIEVKRELTLDAPLTLAGIRPEGAIEVAALLPDQSVKRLLWVRDFRQQWNRTYLLRHPMRLPKGTKLVVYGAGATLVTAPGP
jgi:hypothetical protein